MKLYAIYDRDTGLGFFKFDNRKGWAPVWKDKPKQYKSYPIVREDLYALLNRCHVTKAQICQIELEQVIELPYTALKPAPDKLNGASFFVLLDKTSNKYFCPGRGFNTNLMGAKYFDSIEKAEKSIQRNIEAINKRLAETAAIEAYPGSLLDEAKAVCMSQIRWDLGQLKDFSNWAIIGLAEKRTWLPQSVATPNSGVEIDWDR